MVLESLYADYVKLKKQVQEYDIIKRNIDSIFVKRRAKREKSFCKEMQYLYGFEPLLTKGLKREKYAC